MKILTSTRLLVLSGLLSLTLISGCGSSTSSKSASTSENVFFSTGVLLASDTPDPNDSSLHTLWASGYNGYGQLANGTLSNIYAFGQVNTLPPEVGGGTPLLVKGYSVGANHVLAYDSNNNIWAWGSNFSGRLGLDTYGLKTLVPTSGGSAFSAVPAKIPTISGKDTISSVAAGWKHSLAVVGTSVYAWGDNTYGQLGIGLLISPNTSSSIPLPVTIPDPVTKLPLPVKEVAAGGSHSVARTDDGRIFAWGSNAYAQVGSPVVVVNNTSAFFTLPYKVALPSGRKANKVVAAGSYNLAVLDDNKIYGWGYGLYGQLGRGSFLWRSAGEGTDPITGELLPVQINKGSVTGPGSPGVAGVDDLTLPPGQYQKVAPGQLHVLALVRDPNDPTDKGMVYAWGDNEKGQLGIADAYGQAIVSFWVGYATPVTILNELIAKANDGITDVYAIGNTSFAKIDKVWYGWGDNNWGQLGQPVPSNTVSYKLTPQTIKVP